MKGERLLLKREGEEDRVWTEKGDEGGGEGEVMRTYWNIKNTRKEAVMATRDGLGY